MAAPAAMKWVTSSRQMPSGNVEFKFYSVLFEQHWAYDMSVDCADCFKRHRHML